MLQLFDNGHLSVASRHALDRTDLTRMRVELQLRAIDVFRRDHSFQRRDHDIAGRRRDHEKGKTNPHPAGLEEIHESRNTTLEANTSPRLDQVFASHTAELRVVADQVCQFAALLHKGDLREASDTLLETFDSE